MRGRVLRQAEDWVKIKPFETHDLPITGFQKGRASIAAKLGFRYNDEGAVGAGLSDTEREILWAKAQSGLLVGQAIEVTCMHLTMDGNFRHPDFVRV